MKQYKSNSRGGGISNKNQYCIGQIPNYKQNSRPASSTLQRPMKNYLNDYASENSHYRNTQNKSNISYSQNEGNLPKLNDTFSRKPNYLVDENDELLNDKLGLIQNMWDDLGVTAEYRCHFESYADELGDNEKNYYYDNENESLIKFKNILNKYSNEVNNREETINKLKEYNDIITSSFSENKGGLGEEMLDNISN
ncbi:MAG: hypothetical protein MJ252_27050, partial [archaeon]|nr:hypothetical protein [archaeon]